MSIAVTDSLGAKEFFEQSFVIREQILSMTCEDGTFPNPLDWWRVHVTIFPLLAKLEMKIKIIPAFSAPKERVFTVSGIKIKNYKAHLMPESYNELLFLHVALVSV
jgi:hypothetical protein